MKKISILVPAFNEEKNIDSVIKELDEKINSDSTNNSFNIVIINDASTDATEKIILKNQNNKIIYLKSPINLGIGGAMQNGFKFSFYNNYDIAVQFDGDGQHNADYLFKILEPIIQNDCDICIGSRFINNAPDDFQSSFFRRIGINLLSSLIYILFKIKIKDVTSGFRAYSKKALKYFHNDYPDDYPEPESIALAYKYHLKIKEVPVKMRERKAGKSSIYGFYSLYYVIKVAISIILYKIIK